MSFGSVIMEYAYELVSSEAVKELLLGFASTYFFIAFISPQNYAAETGKESIDI